MGARRARLSASEALSRELVQRRRDAAHSVLLDPLIAPQCDVSCVRAVYVTCPVTFRIQ